MRTLSTRKGIAVALMGLLWGCAPSIQTIKRTKLEAPPMIDQDGLSMELTPITLKQMKDNDDLVVRSNDGVNNFTWGIAAGPAFKVKVTNKNDQIIRLTGAVIKLADAGGNLYDVIGKDELKQRQTRLVNETAQAAANREGVHIAAADPTAEKTARLIQSIHAKIDSIKLLEPKAEILPGFSGTYYLIFDLPQVSQTSQDANADWIQTHQPFKVMVFDVVTKLDQAGNVARKTKFEFPVSGSTYTETYQDGKLVSATPAQ